MEILNLIKLEYILAFATFILPGFIIIKVIRLKIPNKDFFLKDMIFEALSYSLLNLALVGWIPYLLIKNQNENYAIFAFILILTIFPVVLALIYIKLIKSKLFVKHFDIQMPTAWDWFFSQRPISLLLVHLNNGKKVIGYFGENSYATSFPNEGSLYLEKVYIENNDGSISLINNSNGILIQKGNYSTIEFFNLIGENNEQEKL